MGLLGNRGEREGEYAGPGSERRPAEDGKVEAAGEAAEEGVPGGRGRGLASGASGAVFRTAAEPHWESGGWANWGRAPVRQLKTAASPPELRPNPCRGLACGAVFLPGAVFRKTAGSIEPHCKTLGGLRTVSGEQLDWPQPPG